MNIKLFNGKSKNLVGFKKKEGIHMIKNLSTNPDKEEILGCLVDVVEDWLDSKGIHVPNEERDMACINDGSCEGINIWGEDYDILRDGFEKILSKK